MNLLFCYQQKKEVPSPTSSDSTSRKKVGGVASLNYRVNARFAYFISL